MNATIIYYSSNREKPDFEKRVQETILKNSDLPIISVTQKPMDFGHNICVGDVGVSGFNMFRQVQIALKEATTKFVISAESDCAYPPEYFTFEPERDDIPYRETNLYVIPDARDYFFYKKEGATHAQIVGRKFYLQRLEALFGDAPAWAPEEKNFPKERTGKNDIFDKIAYFRTAQPVFQIKTHMGMRYFTHSDRTPIPEIDYWGSGKIQRAWFLYGRTQ